MKLKLAAATATAFLVGSYIQYKFDKAQIKKKAPEIIKKATDKTWSEAFQSGWRSADEDASVRYRHYTEFKDLMEQD